MTPKPMYLAEWAYYAPSVVPPRYPPEVCKFFIGVVLLEMPGSVISEPTDMAAVLLQKRNFPDILGNTYAPPLKIVMGAGPAACILKPPPPDPRDIPDPRTSELAWLLFTWCTLHAPHTTLHKKNLQCPSCSDTRCGTQQLGAVPLRKCAAACQYD